MNRSLPDRLKGIGSGAFPVFTAVGKYRSYPSEPDQRCQSITYLPNQSMLNHYQLTLRHFWQNLIAHFQFLTPRHSN